jgi:mannose-6-phosphate isomerase-like protein (cupin superfamily)
VEAGPPAERGTFDPTPFAEELENASVNHEVGTAHWFENEHVRIWEVRLNPGERGPFHSHVTRYFWTVVEGGRGLQRMPDGSFAIRDYLEGESLFLDPTPETALVHDLENIGDTTLRFVTVELLG